MEKPYIISAELDLANTATNQIINRNQIARFREDLDSDLRNLGKNTLWVGANELRTGMAKLMSCSSLPIVSLDDRHVQAPNNLGISRSVNGDFVDQGYTARTSYPALEEQLASLQGVGREVAIVDDVIFSGEMIAWLDEKLRRQNSKIGAVVCGIAVREGAEKLANQGIDVMAVREFDDVDDEICERDFAVVPGSGRRIASLGANALYFDPTFGKPAEWASIPTDSAQEFAARNYQRAASLLQPRIQMDDIGRFYGLPQGTAINVLTNRGEELAR